MKIVYFPQKIAIFTLSAILLIALCACGQNDAGSGSAGNTPGNLINDGIAAIQGDWIYYTDTHGLYKINIDGSGEQKLCDDSAQYINVAGGGDKIYYQNLSDSNKLYSIDTDGSDRQKLSDDEVEYMNVVGDKIYYCDYDSNSSDSVGASGSAGTYTGIYVINTDGTGREVLSSDAAVYLNVVGGRIYYGINRGAGVYSMKTNGKDRKKLNSDESVYTKDITVVNGWIYYVDIITDSQWQLCRMRTSGLGKQELSGDQIIYLNVAGDKIYYMNGSDQYSLYTINADGAGRQKLSGDAASNLAVVGDWIYYLYNNRQDNSASDNGSLCRIKTDGTDRQVIDSDGSNGEDSPAPSASPAPPSSGPATSDATAPDTATTTGASAPSAG